MSRPSELDPAARAAFALLANIYGPARVAEYLDEVLPKAADRPSVHTIGRARGAFPESSRWADASVSCSIEESNVRIKTEKKAVMAEEEAEDPVPLSSPSTLASSMGIDQERKTGWAGSYTPLSVLSAILAVAPRLRGQDVKATGAAMRRLVVVYALAYAYKNVDDLADVYWTWLMPHWALTRRFVAPIGDPERPGNTWMQAQARKATRSLFEAVLNKEIESLVDQIPGSLMEAFHEALSDLPAPTLANLYPTIQSPHTLDPEGYAGSMFRDREVLKKALMAYTQRSATDRLAPMGYALPPAMFRES